MSLLSTGLVFRNLGKYLKFGRVFGMGIKSSYPETLRRHWGTCGELCAYFREYLSAQEFHLKFDLPSTSRKAQRGCNVGAI